MNPPDLPEKIVVCPSCRGPSAYSLRNAFRPFCSERCKNHDFGAWASEGFRVQAQEPQGEPDSPALN